MKVRELFLIFSIIILYCNGQNSTNSTAPNKLVEALLAQAKKIGETMPDKSVYDKILWDWKTEGIDGYDSCHVSDYNIMMEKYEFIPEISNNFKLILVSQSIEFQTFNVTIQKDQVDIIEFVGAGSNYNGIIQIAFLQVFADATPLPSVQFTPEVITTIITVLRAAAYEKMTQFLTVPPPRILGYASRELYLIDQNNWAMTMTNESDCRIENGSLCWTLRAEAAGNCSAYPSCDDENYCALAYFIPYLNSPSWKPCILCFCAMIYYSSADYPKSDKRCFDMFYPGVESSYDQPYQKNPKILGNIHFW